MFFLLILLIGLECNAFNGFDFNLEADRLLKKTEKETYIQTDLQIDRREKKEIK